MIARDVLSDGMSLRRSMALAIVLGQAFSLLVCAVPLWRGREHLIYSQARHAAERRARLVAAVTAERIRAGDPAGARRALEVMRTAEDFLGARLEWPAGAVAVGTPV